MIYGLKSFTKTTSKYKSQKEIVDGIKFDSKKEAQRYRELKLLQRSGKISDLELQKKYELQPSYIINGRKVRSINYVADFVYKENGSVVIEDTKGVRTKEYIIKKKLFEYKYKIEIKEV